MKILLAVLFWLVVVLVLLVSLIPVIAAPFVTAVPGWLGALLGAADVAVLVLALRAGLSHWGKGLTLAGGFLAVALAAVLLSQLLAHTPPILGADGKPLPGSIASLERVELNGSRQWVSIRGRDVNNPVLVFLSGGPGGSEIPSTRLHLAELEEHFVVVNWDQPGAAKSFFAVPKRELTPQRYIDDGRALAELMRERFDEEKVFLMGESWGTILGVWLVRDYPELFHAFISSGQMVNTTEDDVMGYELALRIVEERGDAAKLEQLRRNGPPPYTTGNLSLTYQSYLGVLTDYMSERAHGVGPGADADILTDALREPEYGLADKVNWLLGLMTVFNRVYPQIADLDFVTQAAKLEVPIYFMVGRHDVNAMTSLVEAYYAALAAPHKELIWFEESGHPPLYSEAAKTVDVVVNRALANSGR